MNTAAASVPAVSAQVRRITASAAPTVASTAASRGAAGHGRWLATAAAAALVILTALTFVLNALEAQEGAEYGTTVAAATVPAAR